MAMRTGRAPVISRSDSAHFAVDEEDVLIASLRAEREPVEAVTPGEPDEFEVEENITIFNDDELEPVDARRASNSLPGHARPPGRPLRAPVATKPVARVPASRPGSFSPERRQPRSSEMMELPSSPLSLHHHAWHASELAGLPGAGFLAQCDDVGGGQGDRRREVLGWASVGDVMLDHLRSLSRDRRDSRESLGADEVEEDVRIDSPDLTPRAAAAATAPRAGHPPVAPLPRGWRPSSGGYTSSPLGSAQRYGSAAGGTTARLPSRGSVCSAASSDSGLGAEPDSGRARGSRSSPRGGVGRPSSRTRARHSDSRQGEASHWPSEGSHLPMGFSTSGSSEAGSDFEAFSDGEAETGGASDGGWRAAHFAGQPAPPPAAQRAEQGAAHPGARSVPQSPPRARQKHTPTPPPCAEPEAAFDAADARPADARAHADCGSDAASAAAAAHGVADGAAPAAEREGAALSYTGDGADPAGERGDADGAPDAASLQPAAACADAPPLPAARDTAAPGCEVAAAEQCAPAAASTEQWLCRHDEPAQALWPPPGAPRDAPVFGLCARTGARPYMEDRCVAQHCALNGGRAHFAALFDGHNGAHAAALAVVAFRDALASRLGRERGGGAAELGAELYDAFGSLNEALRARSDEMGRGEDGLPIDSLSAPSVGGTTAIVAVLDGDVAHIAGVGDSRAVLARGARAVRVSTDHKPKLPAEEERIVEAGGFVARGRVHGILSVSRSLGDFEFAPLVVAEPHVLSFRLAPDDRCLLLASDGLWDVLSDDEAIEIALRVGTGAAADPAAASQLLVDEALRRGSRDNVSVVCVFLGVGRTASESD